MRGLNAQRLHMHASSSPCRNAHINFHAHIGFKSHSYLLLHSGHAREPSDA